MPLNILGIAIPDSRLAREITDVGRDTASPLPFHHPSRVYYFGAPGGKRRSLKFDPELLYCGCMFHDMGLTHQHSSANAARDFLKRQGISQQDTDTVCTAMVLHMTPGTPQYVHPAIALVAASMEMDVLRLTHEPYSDAERETVVSVLPRGSHFEEDIIQAFYEGIKHKPDRHSATSRQMSLRTKIRVSTPATSVAPFTSTPGPRNASCAHGTGFPPNHPRRVAGGVFIREHRHDRQDNVSQADACNRRTRQR